MNRIDAFFEKAGWLKIMASPLLLGVILGIVAYLLMPNMTGVLIGSGLALAGLVSGILWANSVRRKHGTIDFMARNIATPELDKPEEHSA
jgi:hypothetical protein